MLLDFQNVRREENDFTVEGMIKKTGEYVLTVTQTHMHARTHARTHTHTHTHTFCIHICWCVTMVTVLSTFHMQHSIVILSDAITKYKSKVQSVHTLPIQCYYIVHWELVIIIIAMSSCLGMCYRKEAHLSMKFSDDSDYRYFTSTMTYNHIKNCHFCPSAPLWDMF